MFARQIRYAAIALAALASTALPTAQLAAAATGPDLQARIANTWGQGNGSFYVQAEVKNIGNARSTSFTVQKHCGYLPKPEEHSILVEWHDVVVLPPESFQPLDADRSSGPIYFTCSMNDGRMPVAVGITVPATQGEANTGNNDVRQWTFKLKP
jgi:hypothetical protein